MKNRGFTLVEILVTVAIFSIVFSTATAMMVVGTRTFARGNADTDIQKEAQLAVNQIEDMIIDTNAEVDFVETAEFKELILINQLADGTYTKESVKWVKADQKIYYSKWSGTFDSSLNSFTISDAICENELLAEKVTDFFADLSDTINQYTKEGEVKEVVQSVRIKAAYEDEKGMSSYATTPVITLRNRLPVDNGKMQEPAIQRQALGVDVYDVQGAFTGAWELNIVCKSTQTIVGIEPSDVNYRWFVDNSAVKIKYSDMGLCVLQISYNDLYKLAHKTITISEELTANSSSALDSIPYFVPQTSDTPGFSRGAEDNRSHITTLNPDGDSGYFKNGSAKVEFKDGSGNPIFTDAKYNKCWEIVEDAGQKGDGGFDVRFFDDPSLPLDQDVYIKLSYETRDGEKVVREYHVPPVTLEPTVPLECPWNGLKPWGTGSYGDNNIGTGIQFKLEGYISQKYLNRESRGKVEYTTSNVVLNSASTTTLKSGHKVVAKITQTRTDSDSAYKSNNPLDKDKLMRSTFQFMIVDDEGNDVSSQYEPSELNEDNFIIDSADIKVKVNGDFGESVESTFKVKFTKLG